MNIKEANILSKKIQHIGFIMDGNRRWAVKNNLPKKYGHKQGVENLKNILKLIKKLEIKHTTFFTLSKDNKKKRGQEEYNNLMNLAKEEFDSLEQIFNDKQENNTKYARIKIFGNYNTLREDVVDKLKKLENKTKNYDDFYVNFCINYDGQEEIINGVKQLLQNDIDVNEINKETLKKYLYTNESPPPEIIIRCGNLPRLSGFLLWDSQYSEIYFSPKMWPEFNEKDFFNVLKWYNGVERKFGK
ncbi:MAG: polyprenyl diphosphate synthase [Nanoarchaeota archaeon]